MRTPSLVAGGLLVALLLAIISSALQRGTDLIPSEAVASTAAPEEVIANDNEPVESGADVRHIAAPKSADRTFLPRDFFAKASRQRELDLPLADGQSLSLVITHSTNAPHESLPSIEGTVTHPAPGRFIFHKQPPGALPGPFAGVVYFPSLDYGYRLQSAGGRPVLVRHQAEKLACLNYHGPEEPEVQEAPADHPENIPIPAYQNGVIPLQSLPGASGVLYLDFDGEKGPHQGWGVFDAESWNFSNGKIKDIWERVAEDFAPFTLNVTTDLEVFLAAPETSRQRCIITKTTEAAPGAGGVAFVGTFNWSGDTPCWAFPSSTKGCAEVASHELGHTLDLQHDGRSSPFEAYYTGHGSGDTGWAPIMGNSFDKNLTQWSKGEYLNANNTEDDLHIITTNNNSVDYRPDDYGSVHATATPLGFDLSGDVEDQGIIETRDDVDAFLFTTTASGTLDLRINPVSLGPNLDLLAELYDESGSLLESSNPTNSLNANLTSTVAAGTYTVRVRNTGKGDPVGTGYTNYATLGEYTLGGNIPAVVLPEFLSIAENSPLNAPVGAVAPRGSHGGNPLTWAIASGNGLGAFQIDPATGFLTVADPAPLDVETLSAGWNDPPEIDLVIDLTDTVDPNLNESIRVLIAVLDVNEAPTVSDAGLTILEHTVPGRSLLTMKVTDPDEFDLVTFAITGGDPDARFAIDAAGVLSPVSDLAFSEQSSYTLTVTGTDSGSPALSDSATVTINLIDTAEGYLPGKIEHTFYRGIGGNTLSLLLSHPGFPACPDDIDFRPEVHAMNDGDSYGRVVRAFLIPPLTGNYTLWIAGEDNCELNLSTDADPANASTISSLNGWTGYQQWNKFSSQKSATIPLVAGQPYYLEARHKVGGGNNHLSLAWEVKDGSNTTLIDREPIPGLFLAAYALNYCPRLTTASASVRENAIAGSFVHDIEVEDFNPGDTHTFSFTSGNSSGAFAIDPDTGRVTMADNRSLAASYQLGIGVTDSGSPALMAGTTLLVNVLAADSIAAVEPLMEFWDGLQGKDLSILLNSPLFPDRPERLLELNDLDSGLSLGTSYGARVRAYLTPATTGDYTFYLAADDQAALLLSTDEDPANATQIASLSNATAYQLWDKYPAEQISQPVSLVAGQRYFLEARLKEAGSIDHISVGWTGPGISVITVIDSSRIEPYDSNVAPDLSPLDATVDLPASPPAGTIVATFTATDSPFETITFAILDGNEANAFMIDSQSGALTVANPAALHPGPYSLTVAAQDFGHGGYFPLLTTTTTLTIYLDDADHDTLPDPWELSQFGNLAQNGVTDTDLDGLSNRAEFIFGTSATDRFSFPRPEANGTGSPTTAQFSFQARKDVGAAAYQLYRSTNLVNWTLLSPSEFTIIFTTPADSLHNQITVEVSCPGTRCFFRLGVD